MSRATRKSLFRIRRELEALDDLSDPEYLCAEWARRVDDLMRHADVLAWSVRHQVEEERLSARLREAGINQLHYCRLCSCEVVPDFASVGRVWLKGHGSPCAEVLASALGSA